MKKYNLQKSYPILLLLSGTIFFFSACQPLATSFNDVEDAIMYTKSVKETPPLPDSTITVMTWNIRFGIVVNLGLEMHAATIPFSKRKKLCLVLRQ